MPTESSDVITKHHWVHRIYLSPLSCSIFVSRVIECDRNRNPPNNGKLQFNGSHSSAVCAVTSDSFYKLSIDPETTSGENAFLGPNSAGSACSPTRTPLPTSDTGRKTPSQRADSWAGKAKSRLTYRLIPSNPTRRDRGDRRSCVLSKTPVNERT